MANYVESVSSEVDNNQKTFNIIEYLPEVSKNFEEIKAITSVENIELTILDEKVKELKNNQFFLFCNESGIERFEELLKIQPKVTDTLEDRQFMVLARYNSTIPYTFKNLKRQLTTLCGEDGFTCELLNEEYFLKIRIELTAKVMYSEVQRLLEKVLPANIVVDLDLRYNQHINLEPFTHGELVSFTQRTLRNEYLNKVQRLKTKYNFRKIRGN